MCYLASPMLTPARRSSASLATVFTFGPARVRLSIASVWMIRLPGLTNRRDDGRLERRSEDEHHVAGIGL